MTQRLDDSVGNASTFAFFVLALSPRRLRARMASLLQPFRRYVRGCRAVEQRGQITNPTRSVFDPGQKTALAFLSLAPRPSPASGPRPRGHERESGHPPGSAAWPLRGKP